MLRMGRRMTYSVKRDKSRYEWFRMDVPLRHRARVGKTSWQESLRTTDPGLAAIRRAELSARYKRIVRQLDEEIAAIVPAKVAGYVDACLRRLAECSGGSLDRAVAGLLSGIADKVRASWSPVDQQVVEERRCAAAENEAIYVYDDSAIPLLVFDRDQDRDLYLLRERLLEGQGVVDRLIYQQLAELLRARGLWQAAPLFLLPFVVPR